MSLALTLYRLGTTLIEPFAPLVLAARARRGKEVRSRLKERLGRASLPRPDGPLAWLHGASVGEALSLLPLAEALRAARPGLSVLITSGTVASAELLGRRLPTGVIHQFAPIDMPGAIRRFLDHWRPGVAVFAESEVWPNTLVSLRRRGLPAALVSARMSEKSRVGWLQVPAGARVLFSNFALVMAQEDKGATTLSGLGAKDDGRLNLKLAGAPLPADEARLANLRAAAGDRAILLAASTHLGEEAQLLDAFLELRERTDRPLLVLAPRHIDRGPAIAELATSAGFSVRRQGGGEAFDGTGDVYVADALGELGLWYRLARAAFIGGSLNPNIGGHNPLEAARLGTPIIAGIFVDKWPGVYSDLGACDAYLSVLPDDQDIARAFASIIDDPAGAKARAERARQVAAGGEAALDVAARALVELIR